MRTSCGMIGQPVRRHSIPEPQPFFIPKPTVAPVQTPVQQPAQEPAKKEVGA